MGRKMKYRKLGSSGLMVSEIALGSWLTFGDSVDQAQCSKLVRLALDQGINLIDTADVYARGEAEIALAKALASVPRKDYVLASKCYFPTGVGANDRGLSRKHIFESLHASLARLETEYLDLYQCHRFDEDSPISETVRAMDDLIRQGKVLYWGVSSWTAEHIRVVVEFCRSHGYTAPIANQPVYNMLEAGIEEEVLPTCEELGLGLIVYSPLAQGTLSGKYQPASEPPKASRASNATVNHFIKRYMGDEHLEAVQCLNKLARELDLPLAQLALAWCLRQEALSSVIVGVTKLEQLEQNCQASELELSDSTHDEIARILDPLPPIGE